MIAVYPNKEALAQAAAERFVLQFQKAVANEGNFSVVLSGGSTPKRAYELLSQEPYRRQVDWTRVHVFWGDERCVPESDSRSNYRMAREILLSHVPIPAEQIHPISYFEEPRNSADEYESILRRYFENTVPDLVFLGLGTDGHTASLFPKSSALGEKERWVVKVHDETEDFARITVTPRFLNQARFVVFLVEGKEKADILKQVLSDEGASLLFPASLIRPVKAQLLWMVDSAAYKSCERSPLHSIRTR